MGVARVRRMAKGSRVADAIARQRVWRARQVAPMHAALPRRDQVRPGIARRRGQHITAEQGQGVLEIHRG